MRVDLDMETCMVECVGRLNACNVSNGCHSLLPTQAEDGTNEGVTPEKSFDVLTSSGYIRVSFERSENNYSGDVPL